MNTEEKIEVMTAHINKKPIQMRLSAVSGVGRERTWTHSHRPDWNWTDFDYRIKPEVAVTPWNYRTAPVKGSLRSLGAPAQWGTIVALTQHGIYLDWRAAELPQPIDFISYARLASEYEYTLDGGSVSPAGALS